MADNTQTTWTAVGQSGRRFLLARAEDLAAGNKRGPAQIHDLDSGKRYDIPDLQIAFKFNVWEDTSDVAYRAEQGK
jgi:hypothetical protein